MFVNDTAALSTQNAQRARALVGSATPEVATFLQQAIESGIGALDEFRSHARPLLEMLLSRGVDNYLAYVSDLLASIFTIRPDTLKSENEKVSLELVLSHTSMDTLVQALAERRVDQLSFKGMRKLSTYLSNQLAFDLFDTKDTAEAIVEIVEIRNIIAHNRGIVNKIFVSRVRHSYLTVGQPVPIDESIAMGAINTLADSVIDVDARGINKFRLPTVPSNPALETRRGT